MPIFNRLSEIIDVLHRSELRVHDHISQTERKLMSAVTLLQQAVSDVAAAAAAEIQRVSNALKAASSTDQVAITDAAAKLEDIAAKLNAVAVEASAPAVPVGTPPNASNPPASSSTTTTETTAPAADVQPTSA